MKSKNKKAQFAIDPRWVILLMIVVLFILYLREKGII